MNGFRMISEQESSTIDYETFTTPADLVLPDSVGKPVLSVTIKIVDGHSI